MNRPRPPLPRRSPAKPGPRPRPLPSAVRRPFSLLPSDFCLPAVTCLCPTYGRFERLRDAVACFLLQDYPGNRALLISCDQVDPIDLSSDPHERWMVEPRWSLSLFWTNRRFESLGEKRQWLLRLASTPLVAHWDDDDLYLPWHLSNCVRVLQATPRARCAKPRSAWWALGPPEDFKVRGPKHNSFEGQMVFERDRALALGGYPAKDSGQALALMRAFKRAGDLEVFEPDCPEEISYVYRWNDGLWHISGRGNRPGNHEAFAEKNDDFGDGQPLIPGDDPLAWARQRLAGQFERLADRLPAHVPEEARRALRQRVERALAGPVPAAT